MFLDRSDLLSIALLLAGFLIAIPTFTYAYFASDLTSKEIIMNKNDTGVILLDSQGIPFYNFYQAKNKTYVPLSQIPKSVQTGLIATEDKDFYYHPGFSLKAIARSIVEDIKRGDLLYGGSTITQQLVKNSLLTPQKNFLRKYQELVLAYEIERRYSKDEILEMYLNSVYFGEGAFGIEEAAQTFFGKNAKDLNLAESSLLVSTLPSPSRYNPYTSQPKQLKMRQQIILDKMVEQNYITPRERDRALNQDLELRNVTEPLNIKAIHFALMVKDQLTNKFGEERISRSGFKVKTSIDLDWQEYAQQLVANQIQRLASSRVGNGSAVVIDSATGEIKVMVGSIDWYNNQLGKVNVALSLRQPGSAFKPIYYSKAIDKHIITAASILHDRPITYNKEYRELAYSPKNYDGRFRGDVTVRRSLSNSLNIPSVEVMSKLGIPEALKTAQDFGISTLDNENNRFGLALALGSGEVKLLEITNAYATLSNQGFKNTPTAILEIVDKNGETVYKYKPQPQPVISPEAAYIISSILSDNNSRREVFGDSLAMPFPVAIKTGTTENFRDAWTFSYTPYLSVGTWIGNNDGRAMDNIAGSLGAAPIAKNLIQEYSNNLPKIDFPQPSGIARMRACPKTIILPAKDASSSGRTQVITPSPNVEFFINGTSSPDYCTLAQTQNNNPPVPTISPSPSRRVSPKLTPTIARVITATPSATISKTPRPNRITITFTNPFNEPLLRRIKKMISEADLSKKALPINPF